MSQEEEDGYDNGFAKEGALAAVPMAWTCVRCSNSQIGKIRTHSR